MPEFINLSNHRSVNWCNAQRQAAESYGEIVDIPFPQVSPKADSEEIDKLIDEYLETLSKHDVSAIMLQGEFVFTFRLVMSAAPMSLWTKTVKHISQASLNLHSFGSIDFFNKLCYHATRNNLSCSRTLSLRD